MFNRFFDKGRRIINLQKADWLFIAAGLTIFAVITSWTITSSSIWFDEGFNAYIIHFNFFEIARYAATDINPPFYYWLLKLWSMIFGNTELGLRSMSVFFGGISIVFGYLLTHRLFGKKTARISLIFMILSPLLVCYSQEVCMYTLVTAIALAATYTLTFAINTKKRLPWTTYGVLVGLGMLTNYFSALIWITHWLWRADNVRRITKKGEFIKTFFSKEWVIAHAVAVGMFLFWVPFFLSQFFVNQTNDFWMSPVTFKTIPDFVTDVIFYQYSDGVGDWLVLGLLVALIILVTLSFRIYKMQNKTRQQAYRLIIAIAFVPMLLLFMLSMPPLRSVYSDRYLIPSVLGIALFVGVTITLGLDKLHFKWQIITTVFMAGLMMVGVNNVWQIGNYSKDANSSNMIRQTVEEITYRSFDENQPIIVSTPKLFYETVFYSTNSHPVYFIDDKDYYKYGSLDMLTYNDQHKIKDVAAFTKKDSIVWYLVSIDASNKDGMRVPYPNWRPIQEASIYDSVTGEIEYKTIQYKIISN